MNGFFETPNTYFISGKLGDALIFVLTILAAVSCSRDFSPQSSPTPEHGFTQNYTEGDYSLVQHLDKNTITISEQLQFFLEASAPEDVKVEFPVYEAALGDFSLKSSQVLPEQMTGTGENILIRHKITFVLEPYLSGTYTIPAMTVLFSHSQDPGIPVKITTRQLEIPVKSLLSADNHQATIKDIQPPQSLPDHKFGLYLSTGLSVFLIVLAGFLYYFLKKQKAGQQKVPGTKVSPAEFALQELDRLLADNLLTEGKIKLFHLRISDILRRYLENRFGLKAPERTTEEFLKTLSIHGTAANILLQKHQNLLADFLTQCDLVKFARHEPNMEECQTTVRICRELIEKTDE